MRNSILILTSTGCIFCAMLTLGLIIGLAITDFLAAAKVLTWALGILVIGGGLCAACIKEGRR